MLIFWYNKKMLIQDDFNPKRSSDKRLPPGQYETKDFPVLSLGPTPEIDREKYTLRIFGNVLNEVTYTLDELIKVPVSKIKKDIHCVTKWSKLDTNWEGVSLDYIIDIVKPSEFVTHIIAHSLDGYTTNLPIEDVKNEKAYVAYSYEGEDIKDEHGGPVRLLVPHLYFWKSAKWLNKIEFVNEDRPGFWETRGYHNYGDPWKEERYTDD